MSGDSQGHRLVEDASAYIVAEELLGGDVDLTTERIADVAFELEQQDVGRSRQFDQEVEVGCLTVLAARDRTEDPGVVYL